MSAHNVVFERRPQRQRFFIRRVNAMYEDVLSDAVRAVQARLAATGSARSPSVVRLAVASMLIRM